MELLRDRCLMVFYLFLHSVQIIYTRPLTLIDFAHHTSIAFNNEMINFVECNGSNPCGWKSFENDTLRARFSETANTNVDFWRFGSTDAKFYVDLLIILGTYFSFFASN